MKNLKLSALAFWMVSNFAQAQSLGALQVLGGEYTTPSQSTGHVKLRNTTGQDVTCTVKMTGEVTGFFNGRPVTASQESPPVQIFIRANRDREVIFDFSNFVNESRNRMQDPGAILSSIRPNSLVTQQCTLGSGGNPEPNPNPGAQVQEGTYKIVNVHSGKCLNLEVTSLNQNGFNNGARVFQYECPNGDGGGWTNSFWNVRRDNGTQYMFESQYSHKCVDLYSLNGGRNNGDPVQQFDCFMERSSTLNRNWMFTPAGDGSFYITSAYSGKCLEVSAPNPSSDGYQNRDRVQQWQCGGRGYNRNQLWRLVPVF